MSTESKISILFVCMGNICRSPTAEGVFRKLVVDAGLADLIEVDSAGTHAYHTADPADRRAREAAEKRGYSLEGIRARRIEESDFERFDLVIAMDRKNRADLRTVARGEKDLAKIHLMRDFLGEPDADVPDPFLGEDGFAEVFDVCERACRALLDRLVSDGRVPGPESSE